MERQFLKGWNEIAAVMRLSVPTAMRLVRHHHGPVTVIGGWVCADALKLRLWMDKNNLWNRKLSPAHKKKLSDIMKRIRRNHVGEWKPNVYGRKGKPKLDRLGRRVKG